MLDPKTLNPSELRFIAMDMDGPSSMKDIGSLLM
jgi:hypothetical protein